MSIRLDGIGFECIWDHYSRVRKEMWDTGLKQNHYRQSWYFTARCNIRRRRLAPELRALGYRADYFNPFIHIRIFGIFFGAGFSVSWGKDNPEPTQEATSNA